MISPRRATPLRYDIVACLGCVLLAVIAAQLAYLSPRTASVLADALAWQPLQDGLYPVEQFSGRPGSYQWTNGEAKIVLPNPGGQAVATFTLAGGPSRTTQARLHAEESITQFTITPEFRYYSVLLPPQEGQHLTLTLESDTFQETQGSRTLGVVISGMRVAGGGAAPWSATLALAALAPILYALARFAGFKIWQALALIAVAAAAAALWLQFSWQNPASLVPLVAGSSMLGVVLAGIAAGNFLHRSSSAKNVVRQIAFHPVFAALCIGFTTLIMGYRLFALINTYAVNMLFWDQWDFYKPLFSGQGVWGMMLFQHGPHRQGLGGLVLTIVASMSGWNSRVDAFVVGGIIVVGMAVGLLLKYRLFGRLTLADALVPLFFLGTNHAESVTTVPNPAHGALPLLLTMLYALAWSIPRPLLRYGAIVLLNFALVFTGFGIFMGIITPALLALDTFWQVRSGERGAWRGPLVALAGSLLAIFAFSIGYRFETAIACFEFPHPRPWEYPWFMGLMFARFIGLPFAAAPIAATVVGCAFLALLVGVALYHAFVVVREGVYVHPASRTIAVLIGFSLLFCANSAVGRVCSGVDAGQASRYTALLIPAFTGLYLHLLTLRRLPLRVASLATLLALLLPVPLPGRIDETYLTNFYASGKQRWKACYLANEDAVACSRTTGFDIYPAPAYLTERLDYLKAHQVNLYHDQPAR